MDTVQHGKVCDHCGGALHEFSSNKWRPAFRKTKEAVTEVAKKDGWLFSENGTVTCDDCVAQLNAEIPGY